MTDIVAVTLLGVILGTTYGLLAVGLVVVHRSSKVINFAHGDIGTFSGAILGLLVMKSHLPYYAAFLVAILTGVVASVATEFAVMRRLRQAPAIVKIVATIGVAGFLQVFALVLAPETTMEARLHYPTPPGIPTFHVGALNVTSDYSAMMIFSPLIVAALALFFHRTRFGIAIRAAAANEDAARLDAIPSSLMSALSWAIAGGLSAYTAVLLIPSRAAGASGAVAFGPGLLVRGLAAAVLARMTSLPKALAAGVGLGVIEQHLLYHNPSLGRVDSILLLLILGALLAQRQRGAAREQAAGGWLSVQLPRVPPAYRGMVRAVGWALAAVGAGAGLALPRVVSNSSAVILTVVMTFTIMGLGVGVISGLAGQLSLGQFGIAAMGAAGSYLAVSHTHSYALGLPVAVGVGAAVAAVLGLPAVRIRGLMFAVVTMSFAVAVPWLLEQRWLFEHSRDPGRPGVFGISLGTSKRYYYFVLAFLGLAFLVTRNTWRGGVGRRFRAVRDNENAARAFGIRATTVKLQAFAVGGGLAGLAGALYAHGLSSVSSSSFPLQGSLTAVAVVAIGGVSSLAGPLLGALYIIGIPRFLPLDTAGLAATSLGWLILVLQFPGGVSQALVTLRDRALARLGDGRPAGVTADVTDGPIVFPPPSRRPPLGGGPLLEVRDIRRSFGGVQAVAGVSFSVEQGEILGLIGPNGAGKTTVFELISGFTPVESGAVLFRGGDITRHSPERRTRLGLVRSFQDAALFPTLTVVETVEVAFERTRPTRILPELLGWHGGRGERRTGARELVRLMGLGRYEDACVSELSTGTRRITELACLIALDPELLLLDEPTSGIAQREVEALGTVLRRIRDELGTTLVVVEHDIPLIMGLSDRVVAMAGGEVIALGAPSVVRAHPAVVESYLGDSPAAIRRSGVHTSDGGHNGDGGHKDHNGHGRPRCEAVTRAGDRCRRDAMDGGLCHQHAAPRDAMSTP